MALIRKPSACVMKNMQKMLSSNNGRFIVGQMWIVSVILLLTTIIFTVNAEQAHFEGSEINRRQSASHVIVDGFEAKDVQPSSKRSDDIQRHSPKLSTYKKELLGCPNTAKKIMLSMVLEKTNWDDIIDKKRDRALSKLSKLFNVPKDLMVTTNIIQRDISEMEKFALQKGPNVPKNRKRFGKVEFVIGCSDYFTAGNTIAKRISRQMEENLISETSGLNFDWWCIWEKQPNSRTPRSKRDAESVKEGSGEEDDLDDYYYDDDDVDPTEKPAEPEKKIDEHPHRHHHGDDTLSKKDRNEKLMNEKLTALDSAEPKTSDRNIIDMETHQQIKTKPIETQTLASEQSSIQEEVTQLKSVITKTIENNNENVKEVEEELEKIANERKAATEKVILTDAFDTRNDFEPIVETFSEDDAIVIKPKQTIDDQHTAEAQENDYVIEDNTMKNGKLATVDIDNERQSVAITNYPTESHFTTNEFDDGKVINKGFDDVTIGLETAKASWDITQPPSSSSSSSSSSSTSTATTSQESSSTLTTPKLIAETSESQTSTATTTTTTTTTATTPTTSTTVTEAANLPVSVTNKVDSMPITVSNSVSSETNSVESTLRTSEMTTPKVTLPAKNEFVNIPWIINTMGYSRGFGTELMACILKIFQPTEVVQIQSRQYNDNFDQTMDSNVVNQFKFNVFENEMNEIDGDCKHKTYVFETARGRNNQKNNDMNAKDLRYAMILAKLGNCLKYNSDWLTSVKPFEASLNDLTVLVTNGEEVNPSDYLDLLNGNLVYLCEKSKNETTDIVDCHGIGIVRSVDTQTNKVYLISTIPLAELDVVNVLAICAIPLPSAVFLNQHIQIRGAVPFVYNSNNFVGSKQVAHHIFRAERRSNNKPIQLMED